MADHDYLTGRLRPKYKIEKTDGTSLEQGAKYFVMRYDKDGDPFARLAVRIYAVLLRAQNPKLAEDLLKDLGPVEWDTTA